jgi:hypothetical protein
LENSPSYLRDRGLVDFDVVQGNISYVLLCKGHLGSADVLASYSVMADYDIFTKYLKEGSLREALSRSAAYDYLPTAGKDFIFDQVRIKFGRWKVKWKYFHPPVLIPDEETEAVQELYDATDEYLF